MICVGIDVAKDKHDCFILSSEGEVLADVFTIRGFKENLYDFSCAALISNRQRKQFDFTHFLSRKAGVQPFGSSD